MGLVLLCNYSNYDWTIAVTKQFPSVLVVGIKDNYMKLTMSDT